MSSASATLRSAIVEVARATATGSMTPAVIGVTVQPGETTLTRGERRVADDLVLEAQREARGRWPPSRGVVGVAGLAEVPGGRGDEDERALAGRAHVAQVGRAVRNVAVRLPSIVARQRSRSMSATGTSSLGQTPALATHASRRPSASAAAGRARRPRPRRAGRRPARRRRARRPAPSAPSRLEWKCTRPGAPSAANARAVAGADAARPAGDEDARALEAEVHPPIALIVRSGCTNPGSLTRCLSSLRQTASRTIALELGVVGARAQRRAQVGLADAEQAGAQLAVGGQADAVAVAAERVGHRVDEADAPRPSAKR
jgi:hypothetical protein